MIIPEGVRSVWRGRSRKSNKDKLDTMFEFMEFYDELKHGDIMQAYKEAAEDYGMSTNQFRADFALVLRFRECNIYNWFERGITFYHLSEAPSLAEVKKITPAELIDSAINLGGPTGKTMTVDQMTEFALGGKDKTVKRGEFRFFSNLTKFCNLKRWTPEQSDRFQNGVRELIDKIESEKQ